MPATSTYEEQVALLHSDNEKNDCTESDKCTLVPCRQVPARYVLALLGFLGLFITLSMRASLSVAVVAMVNSTSASFHVEEFPDEGRNSSGHDEWESHGEFNWDETTQGVVLGAYFYGYAATQLCGGCLVARLGGRNVFGVGVFISSLLTLLLPLAARAAVGYFIAIRVLQGLAESVTCPAINTLWGVWAPAGERGRLVNFTYASIEIGTVMGMLTSGLLSQFGFAGGWPSVFYIHGMLGCASALLWMLLIYESPDKHPRLTPRERALFDSMVVSKEILKTPWRHIATSSAVWALAVNHFMVSWSYISMASMLPTYMSNIQHFDLEQNGILSSVPFLAQWLSELGGSFLMDLAQSAHCMSRQTSRKLLNGIGGVLGGVFFVAMGYVPEGYPTMAVIVITLAMAFTSLCVCCVRVNHLDIAPRYGGTLYGLTNGLSCTAGFISPAVIGALTEQKQTAVQWRIYFCITAAISLASTVIFSLLGKGEELWWAKVDSYEPIEDKDNDNDDDDNDDRQ